MNNKCLLIEKNKGVIYIFITSIISCTLTLIFIKIFSIDIKSLNLKVQDLATILGVMFTFATIVIAIFGFFNYFQTAETIKRLNEIESVFNYGHDEVVINKIMTNFICKTKKISLVFANSQHSSKALLHCYNIANSIDLCEENTGKVNDLKTDFLEIYKLAGPQALEEVRITLLQFKIKSVSPIYSIYERYIPTLKVLESIYDSK